MIDNTALETGKIITWPGPMMVLPHMSQTLQDWVEEHREQLDTLLAEHGALLCRGFGVDSADKFRAVAAGVTERLLEYVYRSTPRTSVGDRVYTATEYPATSSIPMHNENAYQRDWPMRLVFCCVQPATTGGETPLSSTRNVTRRIDPAVMQMFARRGVAYVRNFGNGADLSWQTTFQTSSRSDVESYCRDHEIDFEWLPGDRLRTRQVCQAVATHPITRETLWFNQAHLFHVSSMGEEHQQVMLEVFGEANLPRHAFMGDGSNIDVRLLDGIRRAYEAETYTFRWEMGDVLILDNMLVGHSRAPYTGARQVLVAMGNPHSSYGEA